MTVPMLLISSAQDMNTPVSPMQSWFAAVEAPQGKRLKAFTASGHAPFLTETARFVETLRRFADVPAAETTR